MGMTGSTMWTSLFALILANLVPLAGALFRGWDVGQILGVYWLESGIVGFYTVLKMTMCRGDSGLEHRRLTRWKIRGPRQLTLSQERIRGIAFFTFCFGVSMFVHGMFLLFLALSRSKQGDSFADIMGTMLGVEGGLLLLLAVTLLVLSHGVSFLKNYIQREEYRTMTIEKVMRQPFNRILVMHVTLVGGGFAVSKMGESQALLAAMVLLKIGLDALQHLREHRAPSAEPQPAGA